MNIKSPCIFLTQWVLIDLACLCAGRSVSQQYAAARDEARNHARIRNAYFQQVRQSQGFVFEGFIKIRGWMV